MISISFAGRGGGMVNEEGVVERVAGKRAWVRITRSGACESCSSRGACHSLSDRDMLVEVGNRLDAGPGDRVELSVPSGSLLKLSVLVYFLPVLALVVGAVLAGALAEAAGLAQTLPAVVGAVFGLGTTILILRRLDRTARRTLAYQPRMSRIKAVAACPET